MRLRPFCHGQLLSCPCRYSITGPVDTGGQQAPHGTSAWPRLPCPRRAPRLTCGAPMADYRSNVTLADAARLLREARQITVTTHAKPDGDAFGAAVALTA